MRPLLRFSILMLAALMLSVSSATWRTASAQTFSNTSPITIADSAAPPTPANPYPATVTVSGLNPTSTITKVTVTITGFSHGFPDDVDMLLVAPPGGTRNFHFWSDVGGSVAVSNLNVTVDDAAANPLPDVAPFTSGTYKPFNSTINDTFPAPAPAGPYNEPASAGSATFASAFNGMTGAQANGVWNLYITDDLNGDSGSISGGFAITITTAAAPTTAGQLVISEFRLSGPAGAQDEFIELYNTTGAALTTQAADASAGLGVAASDGVVRCTVPNNTTIPARGHYLCANNTASTGYSISTYPAGSGTTATANATYTTDIALNAGIAIFNTATPASFTLANRLDAVGSATEANTTYKEGTGYPALAANALQYSFYRKNDATTGLPTDTGNNATDFFFVDTAGTSTAAGQRLGAPGPENLSSPTIKDRTQVPGANVDPAVAQTLPPNRVRTGSGNSGTLSIRRTYTNNTGAPITRLRFRVIDITTLPSPAGTADLRPITSSTSSVSTTGGNVTVQGLTLETPPAQAIGGGFNSSLSATTIQTATPLANGSSIPVNFTMNVAQAGSFRFFINVEALP